MIRAAICDDNRLIAEEIGAICNDFFDKKQNKVKTDLFDNSDSLYYEIDDGTIYHIILLDIEMPGRTGMDLAKKIQKALPDCILIFISSYEKYVFDVFQYRAFRFIPKIRVIATQ